MLYVLKRNIRKLDKRSVRPENLHSLKEAPPLWSILRASWPWMEEKAFVKGSKMCHLCLQIFVILSDRVATAVIQLFSRQTFLVLSFDHINMFSAVLLILFNKISSLEKRKQLELCWYPSNRTHRYSWKTTVEIRNVKKRKKKVL